ncbi:MAG TPA: hypothetical protein VGB72_06475 [Acidobacteriota bacterium]
MKKSLALAVGIFLSLVIGAQGSGLRGESQQRNFVLFFEILDYTKEMGDAVSFFITRVLEPGDQLIIYTPARVYGFSKATLAKPKRDLVLSLQDHLRADTAFCSSNYKILIDDMKAQARDIENSDASNSTQLDGLRRNLTLYRYSLANLQSLRKVNQTLLAQIADMYKTQPGKNHIVMIYQAEFRPVPNKDTLNRLRGLPVISFEANELFTSVDQNPPLDAGWLIDTFKEIPITLHFLYIKLKEVSLLQDIREQSVDMFNAFSRIAAATGGIVETTTNPEAGFKTLVQALSAPAK